jgi:hypothetical protein
MLADKQTKKKRERFAMSMVFPFGQVIKFYNAREIIFDNMRSAICIEASTVGSI